MTIKQPLKVSTVDDYIALQSDSTHETLEKIREIIKKNAPDALEVMSYGMPGYKFHGMLIYFAVFKSHYSLFAMPNAIEVFKDKLKPYVTTKGGIQFQFGQPVPYKLIAELVKFRVKENLEKALLKKAAKKKG